MFFIGISGPTAKAFPTDCCANLHELTIYNFLMPIFVLKSNSDILCMNI